MYWRQQGIKRTIKIGCPSKCPWYWLRSNDIRLWSTSANDWMSHQRNCVYQKIDKGLSKYLKDSNVLDFSLLQVGIDNDI